MTGRVVLIPHKYPLWIVAFAGLILAAVLYSFYYMPSYFSSARGFRAAQEAYASKDYPGAIQLYKKLLDTNPTSEEVILGAAETYLSTGNQDYELAGLDLLQGISLDKYEWERISAVLPAKYKDLFVKKKKK